MPNSDACVKEYEGYVQTSGTSTVISDIPNDRPEPAVVTRWDSVAKRPTYTFFYEDGDKYPTYYRNDEGEILYWHDYGVTRGAPAGEVARKGRAYPLSYVEGEAGYPDSCTFSNEGDLHPASCTFEGKVYRPVHHPHPSDDVHRTTATIRPPYGDRLEEGYTRSTARTRNADGTAYNSGEENVEVFIKVGTGYLLAQNVDGNMEVFIKEGTGYRHLANARVKTTDGVQVKVEDTKTSGPPVYVGLFENTPPSKVETYEGRRVIDVTVVANADPDEEARTPAPDAVLEAARKAAQG